MENLHNYSHQSKAKRKQVSMTTIKKRSASDQIKQRWTTIAAAASRCSARGTKQRNEEHFKKQDDCGRLQSGFLLKKCFACAASRSFKQNNMCQRQQTVGAAGWFPCRRLSRTRVRVTGPLAFLTLTLNFKNFNGHLLLNLTPTSPPSVLLRSPHLFSCVCVTCGRRSNSSPSP